MLNPDVLVVPFEQVGIDAIADVGGKNASLGEMIRQLEPRGVKVPGGFATTASAYRGFITTNQLRPQLQSLLSELDAN